MTHFEVAPELDVVPEARQANHANQAPTARTVLEELFVLLEDYGPAWYTQEHHDRAVSAILDREG